MGSIEEAGCEIKIPVTYRLQQTASVIHHLRPPREHHVCPGDQPIISSLVLFFSFVAVVVFLCLVRSLSFLYQSRVNVSRSEKTISSGLGYAHVNPDKSGRASLSVHVGPFRKRSPEWMDSETAFFRVDVWTEETQILLILLT